MKNICIKVAGSEREPIDVPINPGTTAGEILRELNLEGYWVTLPNSNRFFGTDENIYTQVVDGEKLFAMTPAKVASVSL